MQTVIGRLTADAKISELKDGRKVVNFTLAQNDRFKPKGADEVKQVTSFYNCSYWISEAIAAHLKKGILVETAGRIGVKVWKKLDGEAKASLTLHVQFIRLHGKAGNTAKPESTASTTSEAKSDDLPF